MGSPNVLIVSIDSLRADVVSAISSDAKTTPFFDELSESSTLYTAAFTQGIWTVPSHLSVFTGLYPTEHRVFAEDLVSDGEVSLGDRPTLGEQLTEAGYETRAFYRLGWLSSGGILRGFEPGSDEREDDGSGMIQSIDSVLSSLPVDHRFLRGVYRGTFRGHMADEGVVDRATSAIESATEPFCFFVHLNDAHWPYSPVKPYYDQFSDRSFFTLFRNRAITQSRMFPLGESSGMPSLEEIEVMKDLYLGAVRQVDHHLESILSSMSDEILEDTIVVVFGDHGEAFGEEGELGHNDVIPSVAHVPLLIRDPTGELPEGRVSESVQLADIYRTIGILTGVSVPETNANDLGGERSTDLSFTHAKENEGDDVLLGKYGVWRSPSDYLVWDAIEDSYATHGDASGLKRALQSHIDELEVVQPEGSTALGGDAKQRLRELGYLQ